MQKTIPIFNHRALPHILKGLRERETRLMDDFQRANRLLEELDDSHDLRCLDAADVEVVRAALMALVDSTETLIEQIEDDIDGLEDAIQLRSRET